MKIILLTVIVVALVALVVGSLLVTASNVFHVEVDEKVAAIRECLPGNNCGACGYPGCDGLAAAIAAGEAPVNGCVVGAQPVANKVAEIMGVDAGESLKRVAFVRCDGTCDKAKNSSIYYGVEDCASAASVAGGAPKACRFGCLGYGSCVKACQFDAIHVVNGTAVVDRRKCVACGKCTQACPRHLIEIIPDTARYVVQCRSQDKGKAVKDLCSAGCIGCTLCTKVCPNDAIHMDGNVAQIDQSKCIACGKCAEKCPAKIIRMR